MRGRVFSADYLDQLYDSAVATFGQPLATFVFDKRYLLPLDQLPDAVMRECGERLDSWRIPDLRAAGWFPVLSGAGETGRPPAPIRQV